MNRTRIQSVFFFALFLGALFLAFLIMRPYLAPLFLAFVLYIIWKPLHGHIEKKLYGRRSLAAVISFLSIIALIFLPLVIFGIALTEDATNLYRSFTTLESSNERIEELVSYFGIANMPFLNELGFDIVSVGTTAVGAIARNASSIVSGLFSFGLGTFVMFVALFYLLRDGEGLRHKVMALSPLPNVYDAEVYDKVEHSISSVVKGSLLIAFAQGLAAAIGFLIFGVPNALLWGAVVAVASIIPNVGGALVFVPMIIYLYFQHSLFTAIAVAVWGMLVVGLIDNFLRMFVIKTAVIIHPFIILLSVIGGVSLFGAVGIIAGPIAMSFVYALSHLYPKFVKETEQ